MSLAGALASYDRAKGSYLVKNQFEIFLKKIPNMHKLEPAEFCQTIHEFQLDIANNMHLNTKNIRQLSPDAIRALLETAQNGGTLVMRHGEQKASPQVDNFIRAHIATCKEDFPTRSTEEVTSALKKIGMMLNESNQHDGISGESEIELLGLKITLAYLEANGVAVEILSSQTPRAWMVAKSLTEAPTHASILDCIDYPAPEAVDGGIQQMLEDMPSGGIPWHNRDVFRRYARDVNGDPVSADFIRLSMVDMVAQQPANILRIVVTHTQQMNAVFDNLGMEKAHGKFSRFGHFGFITAPSKGEPSQYLDGVFTKERKLRDVKEPGRAITPAAHRPRVKKSSNGTSPIPIISPPAARKKNSW